MKRILILTAILIFACSSDDSSDNSNQTFLERYDGVVWEETGNTSEYDFWHIFTNETFGSCERFQSDCDCDTLNWGETLEGGRSYVISENTSDRLVIISTEFDEQETGLEQVVITINATNDGNNLELVYSDDPNFIEYYERVNEQPCE